jgi:hypothetical protein
VGREADLEYLLAELTQDDAAGAGDVAGSAAVRLFTQQAGMVRPGFAGRPDRRRRRPP